MSTDNKNTSEIQPEVKQLKDEVEKKIGQIEQKILTEQKDLIEVNKKMAEKFANDFHRLLGELQVLAINVSEVNLTKRIEDVTKKINEFNNDLNDLSQKINALSDEIMLSLVDVENNTDEENIKAEVNDEQSDRKAITEEISPAIVTISKENQNEAQSKINTINKPVKAEKKKKTIKSEQKIKPAIGEQFVLDNNTLKSENVVINLPLGARSDKADIALEDYGWFKIKSKDDDQRVARIRLGKNGRVEIQTPLFKGNYSTKGAEIELNRIFKSGKTIENKTGNITSKKGDDKREPTINTGSTIDLPTKDSKESKSLEFLSKEKLQKLVDLLNKTDNEEMQRWGGVLESALPEKEGDSEELISKRKLFGNDKEYLSKTLDKVRDLISRLVKDHSADRIAAIKRQSGESDNANIYLEIADLFEISVKKQLSSENQKELSKLIGETDDAYAEAKNFLREVEKNKDDNLELWSAYQKNIYDLSEKLFGLSTGLDQVDNDDDFVKIKNTSSIELETLKKELDSLRQNYIRRIINKEVEGEKKDEIIVNSLPDSKVNNQKTEEGEELENNFTDHTNSQLKEVESSKVVEAIISQELKQVSEEDTGKSSIDFDQFAKNNEEEIKAYNEKIEALMSKLHQVRNVLVDAFIKKEKQAGGVVGTFKKMFGRSEQVDGSSVQLDFDNAWSEYENIQKELVEASQSQAEVLKNFLQDQSILLQEKIAEHYKDKENVIARAWRRLGEMNLYNFLDKKGKEVELAETNNQSVGHWDRFWSNRAKELQGSSGIFKLGAKVLSVRLGLSLGLLNAGIFGVTGAAEARGAMVGVGSAFGSRHLEDALQNKIQSRFGHRGEFFNSSEEAENELRKKYYLVKEFSGETEVDDKNKEKRQSKLDLELGLAEKKLLEFESLTTEEQLKKIQENISSIEAYAYVNGVDLRSDQNYQRLLAARDQVTQKYLFEKSVENGDNRLVVRPDTMNDALLFLENRKKELSLVSEKISSEKKLRWAKRLVAATVGVVSGTFAYLSVLRKADLMSGGDYTTESINSEIVPEQNDAVLVDQMDQSSPEATNQVILDEAGMAGMSKDYIDDVKHYLTAGKTLEDVKEATLVHKGDGIERIIQRQLRLNPQSFGYEGDPNDAQAIKKWVGHQASVIAQKQNLADKYFIFNEKNPQYLILNSDKTVNIVSSGKLHNVSEIAAAKARDVAESRFNIQATTNTGEVLPIKAVINIKTGQPDILTDLEQVNYQKLVDEDKFDDAMDYIMKAKARGPIYELPNGNEIHETDLLAQGYVIEDVSNNNLADNVINKVGIEQMSEIEKAENIQREIREAVAEGERQANQELSNNQIDANNEDSVLKTTIDRENVLSVNISPEAAEVNYLSGRFTNTFKDLYDNRQPYDKRIGQVKEYLANIKSDQVIELNNSAMIKDGKLVVNGVRYYLDGENVRFDIPGTVVAGVVDSEEKANLLADRFDTVQLGGEQVRNRLTQIDNQLDNLNKSIV